MNKIVHAKIDALIEEASWKGTELAKRKFKDVKSIKDLGATLESKIYRNVMANEKKDYKHLSRHGETKAIRDGSADILKEHSPQGAINKRTALGEFSTANKKEKS